MYWKYYTFYSFFIILIYIGMMFDILITLFFPINFYNLVYFNLTL